MKQLVLTNVLIHSLFGDLKFYQALPPGAAPVHDALVKAYQQGVQLATGSDIDLLPKQQGCGTCTDLGTILAPAVTLLGEALEHCKQADPESLLPLKKHIEFRSRKQLSEVLLYYKTDAGTRIVRF